MPAPTMVLKMAEANRRVPMTRSSVGESSAVTSARDQRRRASRQRQPLAWRPCAAEPARQLVADGLERLAVGGGAKSLPLLLHGTALRRARIAAERGERAGDVAVFLRVVLVEVPAEERFELRVVVCGGLGRSGHQRFSGYGGQHEVSCRGARPSATRRRHRGPERDCVRRAGARDRWEDLEDRRVRSARLGREPLPTRPRPDAGRLDCSSTRPTTSSAVSRSG